MTAEIFRSFQPVLDVVDLDGRQEVILEDRVVSALDAVADYGPLAHHRVSHRDAPDRNRGLEVRSEDQ